MLHIHLRRIQTAALPTLVLLVLLSQVFIGRAQQAPHKPEFWLGAIDPVVQNDRKLFVPSDYMELFAPPTRWASVAARTSTFEISTQFVLRGTPDEQQTLLRGLRALHMKLAGQFGVLEQSTNPACGPHLEGMGLPNAAEAVARKLHELGGQLDYLDMDEPVTWGHEAPRNKCPQPLAQLADMAAKKVAVYRRYFPNVRLNLIDGVGGNFLPAIHDEVAFIDLLGQRGVHIDFFLADVQWSSNWKPALEQLATMLHGRHIKIGMYCNGKLTSNSDLLWNRDSVGNCQAAGLDPKIAPDMFMIGSWSPYPTRVLPEDRPGTLTHIGKELMGMFP